MGVFLILVTKSFKALNSFKAACMMCVCVCVCVCVTVVLVVFRAIVILAERSAV